LSIPRFTVEEAPRHGYHFGLAMRLMEEVIPKMLSINTPLTQRVAMAYAWFIYLREADVGTCRDVCGDDVGENYREWGDEEIGLVARALALHASKLLHSVLRYQGSGITPPKPP